MKFRVCHAVVKFKAIIFPNKYLASAHYVFLLECEIFSVVLFPCLRITRRIYYMLTCFVAILFKK
jgi:hypothetical protein